MSRQYCSTVWSGARLKGGVRKKDIHLQYTHEHHVHVCIVNVHIVIRYSSLI